MNDFEFLDLENYDIEISDEQIEQIVIEFEDDNFYILKYMLLNDNKPITINGIKFSIEELYELLVKEGNTVDKLANGTEVVLSDCKEYLTVGINGNCKIKNVSRHRVSKDKWEVKIPGKDSLYMTSDHSIIVYRDGELIECKPNEILETDCLVVL
jgi:hypothetical protein